MFSWNILAVWVTSLQERESIAIIELVSIETFIGNIATFKYAVFIGSLGCTCVLWNRYICIVHYNSVHWRNRFHETSCILVLQGYNLSMGTEILLSNTLHICLHIPQIKPRVFGIRLGIYNVCLKKGSDDIWSAVYDSMYNMHYLYIPMYTNSSSDIVWSIFLAHIVCTCTQRKILQLVY